MKFSTKLKAIALTDSALYLGAITPNTDRSRSQRLRSFAKVRIAHRGLHDKTLGIYENTLPAFERAMIYGYGIELDVRLTKDGIPVVFHDESLKRLFGIDKKIEDMSLSELKKYTFGEKKTEIPTLKAALSVIGGKVPLIIEIKAEYDVIDICKAVMRELYIYPGEYCLESFSPLVLRWLRLHEPHVLRGQLSTDFLDPERQQNKPRIVQFAAANLLLNRIGQPDFIAYEQDYSDKLSLQLCKKLFGTKIAFWTVRTPEDLMLADEFADIVIFEGFLPQN